MDLSTTEVRVLGCMMEKQLTTPDIYPLTLNSLRLACNQSTNRDPVVSYDDGVLRDALHRLERRGYARLASGRGSRAPKYRHLLADALPLRGDEHAVLCVLLLRGAQTPGELKQRAERMHAFDDLDGVHDTLARLVARGLVAQLARRPGQKEERCEQLLSADADERQAGAGAGAVAARDVAVGEASARATAGAGASGGIGSGGGGAAMHDASHGDGGLAGPGSLEALEARLARLEGEVAELRAAVSRATGSAAAASPVGDSQVGPETSPASSVAGWATDSETGPEAAGIR